MPFWPHGRLGAHAQFETAARLVRERFLEVAAPPAHWLRISGTKDCTQGCVGGGACFAEASHLIREYWEESAAGFVKQGPVPLPRPAARTE